MTMDRVHGTRRARVEIQSLTVILLENHGEAAVLTVLSLQVQDLEETFSLTYMMLFSIKEALVVLVARPVPNQDLRPFTIFQVSTRNYLRKQFWIKV